jgi:hypothetical protein
MAAIIGLLYWADKRYPAPQAPRPPMVRFAHHDGEGLPASCAWCACRSGADCTNLASPAGGRECGPVCTGRQECAVRQVKP